MNKRYLAYFIMLAGWLFFCYWLYARELYPRFHPAQGTTWPVFDQDLKIPLAFRWGSDIPVAGEGFEDWAQGMKKVDSLGNILILKGIYFRDEAESLEKGKQLGLRRVQRMIEYLDLPEQTTLIEIIPREIYSDARYILFEGVGYEEVKIQDALISVADTFEICFPLKDSFYLSLNLSNRLEEWLKKYPEKKESFVNLLGTADGTGISESADMAWERAIAIKKILIRNGWSEEKIIITTGQRNFPESIRNRCVVIYFE